MTYKGNGRTRAYKDQGSQNFHTASIRSWSPDLIRLKDETHDQAEARYAASYRGQTYQDVKLKPPVGKVPQKPEISSPQQSALADCKGLFS